jgi:anti-sigma B factor antagonist
MFQIELSTHEGGPALRLEGELTIYSVTEARDQLCAALDEHPALQLNLSDIEELDTAGVQLLAWIKQEAKRRGKPLVLFAHSPAVVEVFDLLQVASLFGDPMLFPPSSRLHAPSAS